MREKMICPACGAEMNFHAEKVIYHEPNSGAYAVLGGSIEEAHTCPRCGRNESRKGAEESE